MFVFINESPFKHRNMQKMSQMCRVELDVNNDDDKL